MNLSSRLEQDYIAALKAKRTEEVAVLRMLKAAIKNKQVELLRPLSDAEVLEVIIKQVKQRQDSITQYTAAGRADLALVEEREAELLRGYLPASLSEGELAAAIEEAVLAVDAQAMADMGRVMTALLGAYPGRIDGKQASALVRARLLR